MVQNNHVSPDIVIKTGLSAMTGGVLCLCREPESNNLRFSDNHHAFVYAWKAALELFQVT